MRGHELCVPPDVADLLVVESGQFLPPVRMVGLVSISAGSTGKRGTPIF